MTLAENAFIVMLEAHKGQTRWDKQTSYATHPIRVVAILKQFGVIDDELLAVGYLHDTLEDTKLTETEILELFGKRVLELVKQLTFKNVNTDQEYITSCAMLSASAKVVKIADILSNLTESKVSEHFIRKRLDALAVMLPMVVEIRVPNEVKQE